MAKSQKGEQQFSEKFLSFTVINRNLSNSLCLLLSLSLCARFNPSSSRCCSWKFGVRVSVSPQMRRKFGHISLAFLLKFFNFVQAFLGVSIILDSVWMLNQWNRRIPFSPPPFASPSPDPSLSLLPDSQSHSLRVLNLVSHLAYGMDDDGLDLGLNSFKLPAPWYFYYYGVTVT